jgi:thioredoxin-related protein
MVFIAATISAGPSKSDSKTEKENGIQFYQGNWEEALQKGKNEGKPIFLDISASWCGPCKMLKSKTFPNNEVGKYYNANFINVMVDGEKGEGIELARKYKIRGYPTLIFLDSTGKVIAQTAGYRNPSQFIEIGKQVINR